METNVIQISENELELMKIIWDHNGTAMYTDIYEDLSQKGFQWMKNTIITLLSRLIDKGALTTSKIGRKNVYQALITQQDYQAEQTVQFVRKMFSGNMQGLVHTLMENELITDTELDEIRVQWNKGAK